MPRETDLLRVKLVAHTLPKYFCANVTILHVILRFNKHIHNITAGQVDSNPHQDSTSCAFYSKMGMLTQTSSA